MNANLRNFALWVIIVLLLLALFSLFQNPGQRAASNDITFSQLLAEVDQGKVRDVVIQGSDITGTMNDGKAFQTYAPNDPSLVQRLYGKGVSISARPQGDNLPWYVSLLVSWLPFIALIGVWVFLSRQMQGGAGKEPDEALCTRELAGKTALCFPQSCNPGCQYIDLPTGQCLPGADTGLIYTCVPDKR